MIEMVRCGREELVATFGCSRRLATRLGALMGKHIALSATLLEEARPGSDAEAFLLQKTILDSDDCAEAVRSLLTTEPFSALASALPLVVVEQEGWRVIAAAEETLAEAGWSEAVAEADRVTTSSLLPASSSEILPQKPSHGFPGGGSTAAAFSPEEIARLRVNIFAAATVAEKVAALRQFTFAPLDDMEKASVLLQALADEDAGLRSAATGGLRSLGLEPALADAARLLAEGATAEQLLAADRLQDIAASATELGRDTVLMALLGALRDGDVLQEVAVCVLEALGAVAGALGDARIVREDTLRLILERILTGEDALRSAARATLRQLDPVRPGWVAEYLLQEAARSQSRSYRGVVVEILAGMDLAPTLRSELIELAADVFLELPCGGPACQTVGGFLIGCEAGGLSALAARLSGADIAHQRHMVRLFDNALRSDARDEATRVQIAGSVLDVLRHGSKQVRADIIETRVAARADLPVEIRSDLAKAFLRDLREYARWPLSETMEGALVQFAGAAVEPLLTAVEEHKNSPDAMILVGALGRIGYALATGEKEEQAAAEKILRSLQRLSFAELPCRDSLHLAMGRICSSPGTPRPAGNLVLRTLLGRLQGNADDAATLEALGLVCSGKGATDSDVRTVARLALQHLSVEQPDPSLAMGVHEGEDIFLMGEELHVYADLIPCCVRCLEAVIVAVDTPVDLREELIEELLARWEKTITYEVQWSPANITQLTEAVGRIALCDLIGDSLRVRIANTLARRPGELSVLEALAALLARGDAIPQLDRLGGALVLRLLKTLEETETLSSEDREIYLRILARIAQRGRFEIRGGSADRLFERLLTALFDGVQAGIPGCLRQLFALRDAGTLPDTHAQWLAENLARFTRLAVSR